MALRSDPSHRMPSTLAGLSSAQARPRQGELFERLLLALLVAALAWAPYWYGSNDLVAWGVNALVFPGLAVLYELGLVVSGRSHPVGLRKLLVPAALFAMVVAWIFAQTVIVPRSPPAHPIWDLA